MSSSQKLESSICPHLRVERTLPKSTPPGFTPPVPAFSARFDQGVSELATLIIGAQASSSAVLPEDALVPVAALLQKGDEQSQPGHTVLCSSRDALGREDRALIAYWGSRDALQTWRKSSGFDAWWESTDREADAHGWFLEILLPSLDRYETIFSHRAKDAYEGASLLNNRGSELPAICVGMSGPVEEHVYWGSARDRFAITQTNKVQGERWRRPSSKGQETASTATTGSSAATEKTKKKRVTVKPRKNLCVIRSGQNWAALEGKEREMYLGSIHPTLIQGMEFLRDHGDEVGCFDCRFMSNIDDKTLQPTDDKTFGLAFFDDLASLEGWAKEHKTHLDIWGRFMRYAQDLQGNVHLRLFHEIVVLEPHQQFFEYIGCRPGSGMMAAAEEQELPALQAQL